MNASGKAEGMSVVNGKELWSQVQQSLRGNLSKPSYETWISPTKFSAFEQGQLTLLAPNSFSKAWLTNNYSQAIEEAAKSIVGESVRVLVVVKENSQEGLNNAPARITIPA